MPTNSIICNVTSQLGLLEKVPISRLGFISLIAKLYDKLEYKILFLMSLLCFIVFHISLIANCQKYSFGDHIKVDDVNGFDDTLVTPFKERIEASGLTVDDLDLVVIHAFF